MIKIICKTCKQEFDDYLSNHRKYCSNKCKYAQIKTWMGGENNYRWKTRNMNYMSLHNWLRANFKKKGVCEGCKKKKKTDWACKDHKSYTKSRTDWIELCRRCHIIYDNILPKLQAGRIRYQKRKKAE